MYKLIAENGETNNNGVEKTSPKKLITKGKNRACFSGMVKKNQLYIVWHG